MVSRALRQPRADEQEEQQDAGRQPDVFAVLGTELEPGSTGVTGTAVGGPAPELGRGNRRPPNLRGQRASTSLGMGEKAFPPAQRDPPTLPNGASVPFCVPWH